jgi:hypothetical protein
VTPVEVLIIKDRNGRMRMRFTTEVDGKQVQVWTKPDDDQVEELSITLCYGVLDELLEAALGTACDGCGNMIEPDLCGCGDSREGHGNPMNVGHSFIPMGCDCMRASVSPPGPGSSTGQEA